VNSSGESVTELKTTDGSLVRVLTSRRFGFDNPIALAISGKNVWIANGAGNSITELSSSSGKIVRYVG
jgi:hypothetical protein